MGNSTEDSSGCCVHVVRTGPVDLFSVRMPAIAFLCEHFPNFCLGFLINSGTTIKQETRKQAYKEQNEKLWKCLRKGMKCLQAEHQMRLLGDLMAT